MSKEIIQKQNQIIDFISLMLLKISSNGYTQADISRDFFAHMDVLANMAKLSKKQGFVSSVSNYNQDIRYEFSDLLAKICLRSVRQLNLYTGKVNFLQVAYSIDKLLDTTLGHQPTLSLYVVQFQGALCEAVKSIYQKEVSGKLKYFPFSSMRKSQGFKYLFGIREGRASVDVNQRVQLMDECMNKTAALWDKGIVGAKTSLAVLAAASLYLTELFTEALSKNLTIGLLISGSAIAALFVFFWLIDVACKNTPCEERVVVRSDKEHGQRSNNSVYVEGLKAYPCIAETFRKTPVRERLPDSPLTQRQFSASRYSGRCFNFAGGDKGAFSIEGDKANAGRVLQFSSPGRFGAA